jgi:hypothetical protein
MSDGTIIGAQPARLETQHRLDVYFGSTLFPECLEDWVDKDNPVRAIDAFGVARCCGFKVQEDSAAGHGRGRQLRLVHLKTRRHGE